MSRSQVLPSVTCSLFMLLVGYSLKSFPYFCNVFIRSSVYTVELDKLLRNSKNQGGKKTFKGITTKRSLAIALALCLLVALSIPALAATEKGFYFQLKGVPQSQGDVKEPTVNATVRVTNGTWYTGDRCTMEVQNRGYNPISSRYTWTSADNVNRTLFYTSMPTVGETVYLTAWIDVSSACTTQMVGGYWIP